MNTFMKKAVEGLNVSYLEMMREKNGFYFENQYEEQEIEIPGLQNKIKTILSQLGEPNFWSRDDSYYPGYNPFEGRKKDFFQWDATDGSDYGEWWNLPADACEKICNLFHINYRSNTSVTLYGCDMNNLLRIEVEVKYHNNRHPGWKGIVVYTARCEYHL